MGWSDDRRQAAAQRADGGFEWDGCGRLGRVAQFGELWETEAGTGNLRLVSDRSKLRLCVGVSNQRRAQGGLNLGHALGKPFKVHAPEAGSNLFEFAHVQSRAKSVFRVSKRTSSSTMGFEMYPSNPSAR